MLLPHGHRCLLDVISSCTLHFNELFLHTHTHIHVYLQKAQILNVDFEYILRF